MPQRKKRKYVRRVVNIDQELCQARTELNNEKTTVDRLRKERDDLLTVNEDLRKQLRERGVKIDEAKKNYDVLADAYKSEQRKRSLTTEQLDSVANDCQKAGYQTVRYAIRHIVDTMNKLGI